MRLVIEVEFTEAEDCDFARVRLVGAVENEVGELEGRFTGGVEVSWDLED